MKNTTEPALMHCNKRTKQCAKEEWHHGHTNDGWADVNKPVGQKGCDAEEDHVIEQVVIVLFHLYTNHKHIPTLIWP